MALVTRTRHIPFSQGLNDKIDLKLAKDGAVTSIENCVFRRNGRVDSSPRFFPVDDAVLDSDFRSIQSVSDDELFAFSGRGVYLKKGRRDFERLANKNFFASESHFVSREEEPIHSPSIAYLRSSNLLLACYQLRRLDEGPAVRYFLLNVDTGSLVRKGVLAGARDPVAYVGEKKQGFVYKDAMNVLHWVELGNEVGTQLMSAGSTLSVNEETNNSQLVKISNDEFVVVQRVFESSSNRLKVHRFSFGTVASTSNRVFNMTSLGTSQDIGRVFCNVLNYDADRLYIATTSRIGSSRASIDVFEYTFTDNLIRSRFSNDVTNSLDNEIVSAFPYEGGNFVLYGTADSAIHVSRSTGSVLQYNGFDLIDYFKVQNRTYALISNSQGFFLLDNSLDFVLKFNAPHQISFQNTREIRVVPIGDGRFIVPSPSLATVEGLDEARRAIPGVSLYYTVIDGDRAQDVEAAKIGNYFVLSGSPLRFYDGREVVEYGYVKTPTLTGTTSFEV